MYLWLGALAVVRAGTVEERDPYWQARAGMEWLAGAPLRGADTWSWAPVAGDVRWTSPLWNAALGAGYDAAGFVGIFVVGLVAIGALLTSMVVLARRLGARPLPTLAATVPVLLLGLPFLSPRATVPALALAFFALAAADGWRSAAGRSTVAVGACGVALAAAAVTATGMWLHLSWLGLGPATALACSVLWWTAPGLDTVRRATLTLAVGGGAAMGILLGPYGLGAVGLTVDVQRACVGLITEWFGMLHPEMLARWAAVGVLALLGALASLAWCVVRLRSGRTDARVGLVAGLTTLALPAAVGGFTAVRFIGIAAFALVPGAALMTTALADEFARRADEVRPRGAFRSARVRFWSHGRHWRPVLAIVWVVLLPGVLLLAAPLARPLDEAAVLVLLPPGCRLLSDPGTGGAAVLLRPDVPVWYDGRADYWGRERNLLAARTLSADRVDGPPFADATCIALRVDAPGRARLASALDASPEWRQVARSGPVVGWVRAP